MTSSRPRLLIADDHAGVAKMLAELLSPHCDVVGVLQDGGGVAEAAARLAPVVTLIDLNMPAVHGLEACRQIIQADPGAKVIIMSGMIDDMIVEEATAAGAVACIPKARAASQLLPAITRAWQDR